MQFNRKTIGICSAVITAYMMGVLVRKKWKQVRKKQWARRWLQRRDHGNGRGILSMVKNEFLQEDTASYKNFLRMNNDQFENLLNKIKGRITRQDTNMRQCISPEKRLAITLRFLATGETFRSLMYASRIHETTIGRIVPEVCQAINFCLKDEYLKFPNSTSEWVTIAKDFDSLWNFPLCLGALDGKHINFRPPRSAGSYYYNYKGHHSIVLLALVDANYSFIYVDIGVNGRISDGGVFRDSTLSKGIQSNFLNFPSDVILPGRATPVPYVIVADDAFPLSNRLMKPFPSRNLSIEKKIFNYRLSRARRVVENAFGILSNRFRILLTTITLDPDKVELITLTCCILHNYLLKSNPSYTEVLVEENGENMGSLHNLQGGNRSSQLGLNIREEFMQYFISRDGAVPWQNDSVRLQYY